MCLSTRPLLDPVGAPVFLNLCDVRSSSKRIGDISNVDGGHHNELEMYFSPDVHRLEAESCCAQTLNAKP